MWSNPPSVEESCLVYWTQEAANFPSSSVILGVLGREGGRGEREGRKGGEGGREGGGGK